MNTKQLTKEQRIELARIEQLRASAQATLKKNREAAPTAILRKLARSPRLRNTPRRAFINVFTKRPFGLTAGTVSTQFQRGRHGVAA